MEARPGTTGSPRSGQDFADHMPIVDLQPLPAWDCQPLWSEPQEMHHRGMNVGHVMRVFDGMKPKLVGRAVDNSPLEPAPGHPDGETVRMVVAAGPCLVEARHLQCRRPSE